MNRHMPVVLAVGAAVVIFGTTAATSTWLGESDTVAVSAAPGTPENQLDPELGQSVEQAELDFEDPKFNAPGKGDLLAPPLRGYKLVGYRNAEGVVCMAYLGPTRSPECWPTPDYKFPAGEIRVGGLVPEDSDLTRGPQPGEPVTYGTAPAGTRKMVLKREGEAAVEVKA